MDSLYNQILNGREARPPGDSAKLRESIQGAIASFGQGNRIIESLDRKTFTIELYHQLLLRLFHQVAESSSTFSLAGAMLPENWAEAKHYLFHHAEEEKTHWAWVIGDLRNTGYQGPDPRTLSPHPAAAAYLSYGYYLGMKFPVGRLVMAAVLEGISAEFGIRYGAGCAKLLGLSADQIQFFQSHGELDQGHSRDIEKVMQASPLTGEDFAKGISVAATTSYLYKAIYNSVGDDYQWS